MVDVRVSPPQRLPNCDLILNRLAGVLDPELDESIVDLGFIRSIDVHNGHVTVQIQLPTSWCAANFAFIISEDARFALLALEGVEAVTVRLGDHFAARAIEAAVNDDRSFGDAFADEGGGSLQKLRDTFLRKGYIRRQEKLLRRLRELGLSDSAICSLRVKDLAFHSGTCLLRNIDRGELDLGSLQVANSYLERRAELGLPISPRDPLVVDLAGQPVSTEQLQTYFVEARAVRLSMEANGSLCRALLAARERDHAVNAPSHSKESADVSA